MMRLRVLDLDGSLVDQDAVRDRLADGSADLHRLRTAAPDLRLWALKRPFEAFDAFWRSLGSRGVPTLTLFGSGDFHHLTASFVAAAEGPLSVVHFDNHPDWCRTVPRRHCGSWVNDVLAMPHVKRVVTIGPCSDDLERPDKKGANLAALSDGAHEVFPWRRRPSRIDGDVRSGPGHTAEGGAIRWHALENTNWQSFLEALAGRLPTERLWVTIDKDVLSSREAVTNWDQGELPLHLVLTAIRFLRARFDIVGADTCGDFSLIRHRNPLKFIESVLDQPRTSIAAASAINSATNERLISAFEGAA